MGTALSLEVVLEAVVDQRRDARVRLHHDSAAVAAVASIGTAFGYVRFAAEAHATGTAVAAFDFYFRNIYKHIITILIMGCQL